MYNCMYMRVCVCVCHYVRLRPKTGTHIVRIWQFMATHCLLHATATTKCFNGNEYIADGYECGSSGGGGGSGEGGGDGDCSANDNYVERVLLFMNFSLLFILTVFYIIYVHKYTHTYIQTYRYTYICKY